MIWPRQIKRISYDNIFRVVLCPKILVGNPSGYVKIEGKGLTESDLPQYTQ